MTETKTAAVATVSEAELELARAAILDGAKLPQSADPEVVSRAIVERILNASTAAEVLTPAALTPWRDLLDVPMRVSGFRLNESSFEGGSSVYAVVDAERLDEGEQLQMTCGGRNVLAQLLRLLELGEFPAKVKLTGRRTGEGYQALWVERA